ADGGAMTTTAPHLKRFLAPAGALAAAVILAIFLASSPTTGGLLSTLSFVGRAPTPLELTPGVAAAFPAESYGPRSTATLVSFGKAPGVTIQVFQIGAETTPTVGHNDMQGVPVTRAKSVGDLRKGQTIPVWLGNWPSGVYFVRLTSTDGRIGYAPFVLHPQRLGEHRVAVVEPTLTWQAYNIRDDD